MAADLSVRVSIDGTQAVQQAHAVGEAMTQMGAAGDAAAAKIAASGTKLSAPMREASVAAAQARNMFAELQAAAIRPVSGAGAGAPGVIALLQALEKGRIYFQQMNTEAAQMATLGGGLAEPYMAAARAAEGMTNALVSTRQMVSEMIAEGDKMDAVYAALREQITLMEAPMAALGAEGREAFQRMATGVDIAIAKNKEFLRSNETVAAGFNQEVAARQASEAKEQALLDKRLAAQLAEIKKEVAAVAEGEARKQEMRKAAAERAFAIESESGGALQRMVGGFAAIAGGGPEMVGMVAGMAAFGVAMKGVDDALEHFKEGMAAAAKEEGLQLQLTALTGSSKIAREELEKIKEFTTGGVGGFLKFDDVAQGVRTFQALTNELEITEPQMNMLAGLAAKSGHSFNEVATQVGNFIEKLNAGMPVRGQLLTSMQREGLISQDVVTHLINIQKEEGNTVAAHEHMIQVFQAGLSNNIQDAIDKTQTFTGMMQRLANVIEESFKPFGRALETAMKPAIDQIAEWIKAWTPTLENTAKVFGVNLTAALLLVRDNGIDGALREGFRALGEWISTNWADTLKAALKAAADFFAQYMVAVMNPVAFLIQKALQNIVEPVFEGIVGYKPAKPLQWGDVWNQPGGAGAVPRTWAEELERAGRMYEGTRKEGGPTTLGQNLIDTEDKAKKAGSAMKALNEEMKATNQLIKEGSDAEKEATAQVKLYDAEQKVGLITADQAAHLKDQAYAREIIAITDILPKLEAEGNRYNAILATQQKGTEEYDKTKAEVDKINDAVLLYKTKLLEIDAAQKALGMGTFWQNFTQGVREATNAWGTFGQQTIALGKQITDQLASGLGGAITALVTGSGKLADAFKQMATSILNEIDQMIAKLLIQVATQALLTAVGGGTWGSFINNLQYGYAPRATPAQMGGVVVGPSGPDRIAAMLTAGEYVLSKPAVDRYGIAVLEQMNRGSVLASFPRHFAIGGMVDAGTGSMNIPPSLNAGSQGGGNVNVTSNITIEGVRGGPGATGLSKQDVSQFHAVLDTAIKATIAKEKRPGGLLNKNTG